MNRNNRSDPANIDRVPKMRVVPAHFHREVEMYLTSHQRTFDNYVKREAELTLKQQQSLLIHEETAFYLRNLISSRGLVDFYSYIINHTSEYVCVSLLQDILFFFLELSEWRFKAKTSGATDMTHAKKIINYMNKILEELNKSDDLCNVLQDKWEQELSYTISGAPKEDNTSDENQKLLDNARDMISRGFLPETSDCVQLFDNQPPSDYNLMDLKKYVWELKKLELKFTA